MGQVRLKELGKSSMVETYADIFKALANPSRLRIISLLAQSEELCVCELEAALGHKQPLASYHLAVLEDAGLITHRDEGTWSYYKLNEARLRELLSPQCCGSLLNNGGVDMSEKEKDKTGNSESLSGTIKRFLRGKGSGSCCKVTIEEVEEEKTRDKAETTGRELPDS